MITLFDGCYCSDFSVHPKNWKTTGATCKEDWYVFYRFYDPSITNIDGKIKPKLCPIKGMNKYKTLAERRKMTQQLMDEELHFLKVEGFNPITKRYMAPTVEEKISKDVGPDSFFIDALWVAWDRITVTHRVKVGVKSVINGVKKASDQLNFSIIEISKITRGHIKRILEQAEKNSEKKYKKKWSATRYNCYRGYLMMLFKELVELDACPLNPIRDISKKEIKKKLKEVLSEEQRILIDNHLKNVFFDFRQFVHIFFHSGVRKPELRQLKPPMVDLTKQRYKCWVKKGRKHKEVWRTIKSIAVPYWEHFIKNCPDNQFIFGTRFKPGTIPMGEEMATLYWKKYVKDPIDKGGLGINIDFYSLKHLNTAEIVDALDEKAAAEQNAHTSTAMVVNIYDVKQEGRYHEKLKGVTNSFAG